MGNSQSHEKSNAACCLLFEIDTKRSICRCDTALPDTKSVVALLETKKSTAIALVVGLPLTKDVHAMTRYCRKNFPALFSIVLNKQISQCCRLRLDTFAAGLIHMVCVFVFDFGEKICSQFVQINFTCVLSGANMIAHNMNDVREALRRVGQQFSQQPTSFVKSHSAAPIGSTVASAAVATASPRTYTCPACGLENLTENALHLHFPLYHSPQSNFRSACPICGQPPTRAPFAVHLHNCHGHMTDAIALSHDFIYFYFV